MVRERFPDKEEEDKRENFYLKSQQFAESRSIPEDLPEEDFERRLTKRNAEIDAQNLKYWNNKFHMISGQLVKAEREFLELQERWDRERAAYQETIVDLVNQKEYYANLLHVETEQSDSKRCAACGNWYKIKGGAYAKHIKKCGVVAEPPPLEAPEPIKISKRELRKQELQKKLAELEAQERGE